MHRCVARWPLLGVAAAIALAAPPRALAGGDLIDLAVGGGRIWLVGPGVSAFDAGSGRLLARPVLAGTPYALSVALAAGGAWVASTGYVDGTLTRVDERSGRVRVVWGRPSASVQSVAAGAGSVWAMIGDGHHGRIARFAPGGRLIATYAISSTGWIAADASGCWVSSAGRLLHVGVDGRLRVVLRARIQGPLTTGTGAAWLPTQAGILRVDERTGARRRLATGSLHGGGFQHSIAVGAGSVWVLQADGSRRSTLLRLDPATGRRTGSVAFAGPAEAVVVRGGGVWVATTLADAAPAGGQTVTRFDARTLTRTLVIRTD